MKNFNENTITKKDLNQVFWRSMTYNGSFNYERQLNLGWVFVLMPILRKLYGHDENEMSEAMQRHLEFNNITPFICTILFGITIALEEENARDENFDTSTINAVKVGLMGPLSGIGDSIFFGTIRTIGVGIATDLALKGSVLGPILYVLIFNIPNFVSRYLLVDLGYNLGTSFLDKAEESGVMNKLFEGSAILGLMVVGSMVANLVNVPLTVSFGDFDLLETLNGIIPGILSMGFTLAIYQMLKKDIKVTHILVLIVLFSIGGAWIGVF